MSVSESEKECPLCMEPLDWDDLSFFPCSCGYQICRFCWHRLRTDENGLCPACRQAFPDIPVSFNPEISAEELKKQKKRNKEKRSNKDQVFKPQDLATLRVVQKNLVFVIGLSSRLTQEDLKKEFAQFGKIIKFVHNKSTAYITYSKPEEAIRAIRTLNGSTVQESSITPTTTLTTTTTGTTATISPQYSQLQQSTNRTSTIVTSATTQATTTNALGTIVTPATTTVAPTSAASVATAAATAAAIVPPGTTMMTTPNTTTNPVVQMINSLPTVGSMGSFINAMAVPVPANRLKASLGTTKYCNHFLRSQQCPKVGECMYLHEIAEAEASFTKEQMQAGKHVEYEKKLMDSYLAKMDWPNGNSSLTHQSNGFRVPLSSSTANNNNNNNNNSTNTNNNNNTSNTIPIHTQLQQQPQSQQPQLQPTLQSFNHLHQHQISSPEQQQSLNQQILGVHQFDVLNGNGGGNQLPSLMMAAAAAAAAAAQHQQQQQPQTHSHSKQQIQHHQLELDQLQQQQQRQICGLNDSESEDDGLDFDPISVSTSGLRDLLDQQVQQAKQLQMQNYIQQHLNENHTLESLLQHTNRLNNHQTQTNSLIGDSAFHGHQAPLAPIAGLNSGSGQAQHQVWQNLNAWTNFLQRSGYGFENSR